MRLLPTFRALVEIIRPGIHQNQQTVTSLERQRAIRRRDRAARVQQHDLRFVTQSDPAADLAGASNRVAGGGRFGPVRVLQRHAAGIRALSVGGEPKHHHIGRVTREILAPVPHPTGFIRDRVQRALDIQFAPVIAEGSRVEPNENVPEVLIAAGIILVAGPERVFVELNVFLRHTAKNRRAEPAMADGIHRRPPHLLKILDRLRRIRLQNDRRGCPDQPFGKRGLAQRQPEAEFQN